MSADKNDEAIREMGGEAQRMQDRVDELGEHIKQASGKARYTREQAGDTADGRDAPSGEMETPVVSRDPDSGEADPGEPLDEVVGEDDVTPGDDDDR
jgi:hypothetical protein